MLQHNNSNFNMCEFVKYFAAVLRYIRGTARFSRKNTKDLCIIALI
jgi:hypothetical protein